MSFLFVRLYLLFFFSFVCYVLLTMCFFFFSVLSFSNSLFSFNGHTDTRKVFIFVHMHTIRVTCLLYVFAYRHVWMRADERCRHVHLKPQNVVLKSESASHFVFAWLPLVLSVFLFFFVLFISLLFYYCHHTYIYKCFCLGMRAYGFSFSEIQINSTCFLSFLDLVYSFFSPYCKRSYFTFTFFVDGGRRTSRDSCNTRCLFWRCAEPTSCRGAFCSTE